MNAPFVPVSLVRVLRAAVSLSRSGPPSGVDEGETAARSACVPQSATPGAGTPGAAVSQTLAETRDMSSVTQARVVGAPKPAPVPAPEISPAQHTAILRWHGSRPINAIEDDISAHPRFPCIAGGAR